MMQKIKTMDQAREFLKGAGLKVTAGRVALLKVLIQADQPVAQRDLLRKLEKQGFNRVSVYRALRAFMNQGIVHRIVTEDRVWRFAVSRCGHKGLCGDLGHCHPHFVCRKCEKIQCLVQTSIPDVAVENYRVEEQAMYLWGVCDKCLEEEV